MATHSNVLAWRIPGTVEPGGLPSMGSHRVGHDLSDLAVAVAGRHRPLPKRTHCLGNKNCDKSLIAVKLEDTTTEGSPEDTM